MNKVTSTVLRNSAFGMAAQMMIKVLSFGFTVFIVRHLGAETFGQYAAVAAFGSMFIFISDLGLSVYTVREVARWRDAPDGTTQVASLYGNVLALRIFLSIIAGICMISAAWLTGRPLIMIGAIALNVFGLIMYGVQGASDAILAGFERLDLSSAAKVLNQLAFVLLGALALWAGLGYYGLIFATLVGIALLTYVCWQGVRRLGIRPGGFTPGLWPGLLRASIPFGIIGFALGLSYKFDSVLLNIFRSDAETGYYSAVYNLIFSAVLISNVLNTSLYPTLARQAANAPHYLPMLYERTLRYLLVLALPIAVGGWALADQLVPFLFSTDYDQAVPALQILIWVVPFMYVSEFLGYVVIIAGQERNVARAVIISSSLNVAINLLLVPYFGFMGAAVMTVATEVVLVGQYLWLLRTLIGQFDWGQVFLRPLLATLAMGGGILLVQLHVPLLASIVIGVITYLVFLLIFGVAGKEELQLARSVLTRLEARIAPRNS